MKLSSSQQTFFIAAHAASIVGKPDDEGLELINKMIAHCTQPKYVCAVEWKQAGDMVRRRMPPSLS
jgi:alpha-ketoglutarate-dependent 2,4-dichlorophenoxyacetate dioxygenase